MEHLGRDFNKPLNRSRHKPNQDLMESHSKWARKLVICSVCACACVKTSVSFFKGLLDGSKSSLQSQTNEQQVRAVTSMLGRLCW